MTGMEDVLMEHELANSSRERYCICGAFIGDWAGERTFKAHVAEALAVAGFGNLHDAWAEGAKASSQAPYVPERNCHVLPSNPYQAPKVSET